MLDYKEKYREYLCFFNKSLQKRLNTFDDRAPSAIKEAMRYAIEDGGKRVRPVLCYATCEMLGKNIENVKETAIAIECIHSYSLVHDDLPSMDNDDFRRGKLSTHKKYGEAIGVLAGDALLNFAFETMLSKKDIGSGDIDAMRIVAEYAGYCGMIGGQVLDLQNENNPNPTESDLYEIYLNKTAKLISAPILAASAVCDGKYFDQLKDFGYHLGILFQITDDLIDVFGTLKSIGKTPHKDESENKLTAVKIFGVDGAKERAKLHYKKAKSVISEIDELGFLSELTDAMFTRRA